MRHREDIRRELEMLDKNEHATFVGAIYRVCGVARWYEVHLSNGDVIDADTLDHAADLIYDDIG